MRKYILIFALAILAIILDSALNMRVSNFNIGINLVVIIIVGLSSKQRFSEAVFFAGVAGLIIDFLSDTRFGMITLTLLAISQVLYLVKGRVNYESAINLFFIIFTSSVLYDFLSFIFSANLLSLIISALLSALVGTALVTWFSSFLERKRNIRIEHI